MATGQYKLKDHVLELLEWTSKKTGTSNSIDTGECGKDADTRPTTVTEAQRRLDRIHKAWEEIVKNGDDSPFDAPTQKLLFKSLYNIAKAYRLYKRSDPNWAGPLESIEALRRQLVVTRAPLKDATATSSSSSSSKASSDPAGSSSSDSSPRKTGLPTSIHEYRTRLIQQKKDLYKDPPALPPSAVVVQHQMYPLIQLCKSDKTYRFEPGAESDAPTREFIRQFRPNVSPGQVLRGGAFGGTYFRSIHSAVTNQRYTSQDVVRDTLPSEWIQGLDAKRYLTSSTYRTEINKFGVKCGGSLGMWESSGWISDVDPYGWFQWYCRFFQGRRCSDDGRQIARWLGVAGPKGRFRSQLCNKILLARASSHTSVASISPVIRQTLFHWGLNVTDAMVDEHQKRKRST